MFTRQHHKEIAQMVAKMPKSLDKHILIADLSDLFQKDNEKFQPDKFLEACQPHEYQRAQLALKVGELWDVEADRYSHDVR